MSRPELDAPFRVMTIIWAALMMGVAAFAAVAWFLVSSGTLSPGAIEAGRMNLFAPVLLVLMAGGIVVGRRLEGSIDREAEDAVIVQRYQAARIVGLALIEGPALAIIALSLVAGTGGWILGGAGAALWAMYLARPRREDLEALLRR